MLFSSIGFIFYFLPVALVGYCLLGFSRLLRNLWLLLASLVFYAWGEPGFVVALVGMILVNHCFGLLIDTYRDSERVGGWVVLAAVIFNAGIPAGYKSFAFLADNVNFLPGFEAVAAGRPHLPVGISFFALQAISYVVDVHRRAAPVERNPLYTGLYLALFPKLTAGPIERYADFAGQLRERGLSWERFAEGCARFVVGLGKKVVLADAMAVVSDRVFELSAAGNQLDVVPASLAWLGAVAYALRIYFDFSGYSDMAVGLGGMFGFSFTENFEYPYVARSVTEFWRRWHISLSAWFRTYVYLPLGGSRPKGATGSDTRAGMKNFRVTRNLFVVWLLIGFWHGANWTFIAWGMWHFLFILLERLTKFSRRRIPNAARSAYLLLVVLIGWVLFRSANLTEAARYLANMLAINDNGVYSDLAVVFLREYWLFFLLGVVFSTPFASELGGLTRSKSLGRLTPVFAAAYPLLLIALFAICVVYLVNNGSVPFIYFSF